MFRKLLGDLQSKTMDNGSIRAPSVPVRITPPYSLSGVDWDGEIHLQPDTGLLFWSLYDMNTSQLLYQGSDYTVSEDGHTATFSHTFPPTDSGDTYTITQDVMVT